MNFKLKRNEIILLSALGVLIYAFIFYKFIWIPVVPEIGEQKDQISRLESQKQSLDTDIMNLEMKKTELQSKQAGDERLAGYLNNETNVTDCIEYMDKLTNVVGSEITGVNIAAPEKKEVNQSTYYEIKIEFSTKAKLNKIMDMVEYIESSSRIIKVNSFRLAKEGEENAKTTSESAVTTTQEGKNFIAALNISMFALNLEAADKLYEYGRHKFNRFDYGAEAAFGASVSGAAGPADTATNIGTSNSSDSKDFEIKLNSFFAAGDNFIVFGPNRSKDGLSLKTNKYLTMDMSIEKNSYSISVSDASGKSRKMSGTVPDRDINMYINVQLSEVSENNGLNLKLNIKNNSGNNLYITSVDKSDRVRLYDRQGKGMDNGSNEEKVTIK